MQQELARLRNVTEEDMDLLYQWANETAVRVNAFSTEPIPYQDHQHWFTAKLHDPNTKIYIYLYEERPVGQIRLDIDGDQAGIDYSIDVHYRHQGHGKRMLQLLEQEVQVYLPSIAYLTAQVKCENNASRTVFAANGYEEQYVAYSKKVK